ncbi:MAG: signal peptidase II [Myxococcales bacterium]|nr:signal peptidase II [Myxococcales bacterium]
MQRYLLLIVGSVLSIALDQWSKIWAVNTLLRPEGSTLPTDADHIRTTTQVWVEGFWNMRLAGNKGAAWSIFRDMPETWRVPFFVAISVVAVGVIFHLYRKAEHSLTRWSLMLILGGAIGNLIDRVRLGFVVDFIQWHYQDAYWPTFNVADICISVGVGLMVVDMLRQSRAESAAKKAAKAAKGADGVEA